MKISDTIRELALYAKGSAQHGLLEELAVKVAEMERELESLRSFKRGVDEALNSGDGTYRP